MSEETKALEASIRKHVHDKKRMNAKINRLKEDVEKTKHLLNQANAKLGIIKNNSKCCRNSQKKCDGCLACCG